MKLEDYSNREIDSMIISLHEKIDKILDQTTKTNGKVADLQDWKSFSKGAIAVITVLIIPLILYVAQQYLTKS